ncbi:MAG: FHA domain-containing protein, partial [Planctomycetaceae bacterium]
LRVVGGKSDGKLIPLAKRKFLIGREQDCHLRPNSELVSRHHCVLYIDDFTVRLRDLGSTNGTLLNGERLYGEVMLNDGDRVSIGQLEFEVQIPIGETADATEEKPPKTEGVAQETAEMSANDTVFELPAIPDAADASGDTTVITPQTADAPQPVGWQPPGGEQVQYAPYAYPPAYGQYPQYPQPPYPQYPQPYPYPQQYPPGYYPQQYGDASPPAAAQESGRAAPPEVRLPDPSETGLKALEAPAEGEQPAKPKAEGNPSKHAADIIRNFRHRRPSE